MINRAHKIKLKPNKAQAVMLSKTAGTARYAYNWALSRWKELYKQGIKASYVELSREWTKTRPEWASEVSDGAPRRSIMNLTKAYKSFFKGTSKPPVFHKKGRRDSFYIANDKAVIYGNKIKIPLIGRVRMTESLRYSSCKIMSYTVSSEAGSWYVSVQVEMDEGVTTDSDSFVGVDVGCKALAIASDGTECRTPGMLKDLERQLKRKQRLLSRKKIGSKNRAKARTKIAKVFLKIKNIKQDAVHKFTAVIAKSHGIAVIEDLDVKAMQEGADKRTRKGVHNSCMAEIQRQLMYKCNNYIKVDRYYPSSKTCSNCGFVKADLLLCERTFNCPSCGQSINRDFNAALNLLHEGIRIYTEGHSGCACGESLSGFNEAGSVH